MTLWPSELYVYSAILLLALCSVLTRAGFMLFGDYIPVSYTHLTLPTKA